MILGHRGRARISAYLYGDILTLAAAGGLTPDAIESGEGAVVVAATVVSTFIAHVLSDSVAASFEGRRWRELLGEEIRDSLPILSAGLPCLALYAMVWLGWLGSGLAQSLALGLLIVRLAATGLIYRHLTGRTTLARALWLGIVVALVGGLAAALKMTLTH